MLRYMSPWPAGKIPRVLMMGNGIHRAFGSENWDALLKSMTDGRFTDAQWKQLSHDTPYPLLAVIASDDNLDTRMREKGASMCEQQPEEAEKQVLKLIAAMQLDAVLTTNYTYDAEYALIEGFSCRPRRKCGFRHHTCHEKPKGETEALYTYMASDSPALPPIWHIHGEAAKPDTMVIGHYYYGKLLSYVRDYVAETVRRYHAAARAGDEFYPRSWVDYFLFGDVTLVGQGMSLCEMDLWWLFNCKKRNGCGSITYIEPNIAPEKQLLAEAYGVNVITKTVDGSDAFKAHYRTTFQSLCP